MRRYVCLLSFVILAISGGRLEANEDAIAKGVVDYLSDKKFCLDLGLRTGEKTFWVDLEKEAGEKARVLESEELIEIGPKEKPGIMYKEWAKVRLSDALQPLIDQVHGVCLGAREFISLDVFTTPGTDALGRTATMVAFFYRVVNAPEWASRSSIRKAFPDLDAAHSGRLRDEIRLIHTNKGWRHAEY